MKINGLMIDCSRMLEAQSYYFRLLEFMSQWDMNTLLLHFSDDHGCALNLEGAEELSVPKAWTMSELQRFLASAEGYGIDVIPELETFGHTRYITNHPKYQDLFAGKRTRALHFNAVDPLHEETYRLMQRLIQSVARAFPSAYIHLGCDEVDIAEYCRRRGLRVETVWADYVNRMIGLAREAGKIPMIWADHVVKSDEVADRLRKDVVLAEWRYGLDVEDEVIPRLRNFGFNDFVVAPALACHRHRFLPTRAALDNTDKMTAMAKRHQVTGVINTIWCPWRYLQNAMYYGIAYSACAVRNGATCDGDAFHGKFARKTFGTELLPSLRFFLEAWPELAIAEHLAFKAIERHPELTQDDLQILQTVAQTGEQAIVAARDYSPKSNQDIWRGMVLAAKCAWLCAESLLLRHTSNPPESRMAKYDQRRLRVRKDMNEEWDRTRYPDDPQKTKGLFPNEANQHAMAMIRSLPRAQAIHEKHDPAVLTGTPS